MIQVYGVHLNGHMETLSALYVGSNSVIKIYSKKTCLHEKGLIQIFTTVHT